MTTRHLPHPRGLARFVALWFLLAIIASWAIVGLLVWAGIQIVQWVVAK